MITQTIKDIKSLLINAGYEKDLDDIFFIEDMEPLELETIEFDIEPIEMEELY